MGIEKERTDFPEPFRRSYSSSLLTSSLPKIIFLHWSARSKKLLVAPGITTRNKKLLVTKGIATRSKDTTSSSWPFYWEREATSNKGHRY